MEGSDYDQMDLEASSSSLLSCIESLGFPSSSQLNILLYRIRELVSLWLSYPMRIVPDRKLKAWIRRVSKVHGSIAEKYYLIQENPLRYLKGHVPIEMMMENEMEAGGSSITSMLDHDDNTIPDAIHNLAAGLAVNQLVQTLLSGDYYARNIHHVMISTRNNNEQRQVFENVKVVLKDMDNMARFNEIFHGLLSVDVSMYQSQVKVEVLVEQQIRLQLQLQLPNIKQSNLQRMSNKKVLVLLLDGDAEKTTDLRKVSLPAYIREAAVMVLITTEFQKQANDKNPMAMDLTISTNDHLLPWKVFRQTVGNELVLSSSAFQKIAVRLVQECGGHLLAIVYVAKSLKNVKDVKLWELALNKFCCLNPFSGICIEGVSKVMVTAFIYFIWNDMNGTLKHCLTSCLFIPDIKTGKSPNELMYHWISYRLTDDREAMHVLRELVESSILLQDQYDDNYVQLPEDTYAILNSLNTLIPLFMKNLG